MSNQRMHWAIKAKWGAAWKEAVWGAWLEQRPRMTKIPLEFAKITVFLHVVTLMDYDGAYNAVKPLLDALKVKDGIGIIIDDSPKYIDLEVKQIKTAHRVDEHVSIQIDAG